MPGPVVNGVRHAASIKASLDEESVTSHLPLIAEGTIRLLLLNSGDLLMARLRSTTDPDGQTAYQLIRPRRVVVSDDGETPWRLEPYLKGFTSQSSLVLFKHALASVLEPDGLLLQAYSDETAQECPYEETPVERLKRAFQEFTDSLDA